MAPQLKPSEQQLTISVKDLLLIVVVGLGLVLIWQLWTLVVILMISVVLAASIAPLVDQLEKWRFPRWLAAIAVYFAIISSLIGTALLIGPNLFEQIERLLRQLPVSLTKLTNLAENWVLSLTDSRPELIGRAFDLLDIQSLISWSARSGQQLAIRSYSLTAGFVGAVFGLVLALFLSGYMVVDSRTLTRSLLRLFPDPWDERLAAQIRPASQRMGSYIRGRLLVSAILGVIITLSLSALGLSDFALGLGAIAGVTNLIPFLGPVLGAIPALVVALSQGWWTLLWVLILFIIIQNLETYVLDPLLVGSSVGLHPLYQLLAVLGGTQVLGIIGAIIVPPWVAGAAVLLENLYLQPKILAEQKTGLKSRHHQPIPAPNESG